MATDDDTPDLPKDDDKPESEAAESAPEEAVSEPEAEGEPEAAPEAEGEPEAEPEPEEVEAATPEAAEEALEPEATEEEELAAKEALEALHASEEAALAESADFTDEELRQDFEAIQSEIDGLMQEYEDIGPIEDVGMLEDIYYIWILWGDFHVDITEPELAHAHPPKLIEPEFDAKTKTPEHVYRIFDYTNRLSTSVGEDLAKGSRATGKLLNTVKKIMDIAIKRAKSHMGEGSGEAEEEIEMIFNFSGHEICQRKAFRVCVDSGENINIANFDPGEWGERQLRIAKTLVERGYLTIPDKLQMGN